MARIDRESQDRVWYMRKQLMCLTIPGCRQAEIFTDSIQSRCDERRFDVHDAPRQKRFRPEKRAHVRHTEGRRIWTRTWTYRGMTPTGVIPQPSFADHPPEGSEPRACSHGTTSSAETGYPHPLIPGETASGHHRQRLNKARPNYPASRPRRRTIAPATGYGREIRPRAQAF